MAEFMAGCLKGDPRYPGLDQLILTYAKTARRKCETLRTDDDIYDVWSDFVVAGETITDFVPLPYERTAGDAKVDTMDVRHMLKSGVRLISFITRARTPMPLSTQNFLNECAQYKSRASAA